MQRTSHGQGRRLAADLSVIRTTEAEEMFGFLRRDLHVEDERTPARLSELLRDRGPLFVEAAFRHTSSDYYILTTDDNLARVLAWFVGRGGGKTPLFVNSACERAAQGKPVFEGDTSGEGWQEAIRSLAHKHTLVLMVGTVGNAPAFHLVQDEDEWDGVRSEIQVGTDIKAYKASHFGGRRCLLTVWSGTPDNNQLQRTRPG
jgi:hypothetical protein